MAATPSSLPFCPCRYDPSLQHNSSLRLTSPATDPANATIDITLKLAARHTSASVADLNKTRWGRRRIRLINHTQILS